MDIFYKGLFALTSIIPLSIGIALGQFRKDVRLFFLYICFSVVSECIFFSTSLLKVNNHPLLNGYIIIEFIFLSYIIRQWIQQKKVKLLITLVIVLFTVLSISSIVFYGFHIYNQLNGALSNILLMLISAYYLIELVTMFELEESIFTIPQFWISSALLIFFGSSTFILSFLQIFAQSGNTESGRYFSYLNSYINLLCNIMYSIAFLCRKFKKI